MQVVDERVTPQNTRFTSTNDRDLRAAILLLNDGFSKLADADGTIAVEVRRLLDARSPADIAALEAAEEHRRSEERAANEAWAQACREARADASATTDGVSR